MLINTNKYCRSVYTAPQIKYNNELHSHRRKCSCEWLTYNALFSLQLFIRDSLHVNDGALTSGPRCHFAWTKIQAWRRIVGKKIQSKKNAENNMQAKIQSHPDTLVKMRKVKKTLRIQVWTKTFYTVITGPSFFPTKIKKLSYDEVKWLPYSFWVTTTTGHIYHQFQSFARQFSSHIYLTDVQKLSVVT